MSAPSNNTRRKLLIAACAFTLTFAGIRISVKGPGLTWDEPFYVPSALSYSAWFAQLGSGMTDPLVIYNHWAPNHEHPPFAKLVISAAIGVWGDPADGPLWYVYAARTGTALLAAILVAVLLLFIAARADTTWAVFAALSLILMPRFFGHAHIAALDLPMAFTWFLAVIAYAKALESGPAWSCLAGLAFGLALLTKINALAIPVVIIPWAAIYYGRKAVLPSLFLALGLLIFILGWPWLWFNSNDLARSRLNRLPAPGDVAAPDTSRYVQALHAIGREFLANRFEFGNTQDSPRKLVAQLHELSDLSEDQRELVRRFLLATDSGVESDNILTTQEIMAARNALESLVRGIPPVSFEHIRAYINTLRHRSPIPVYYFGRTYKANPPAPFHYPLFMALATLPLGTAIAFLAGAYRVARKSWKEPIPVLFAANAAFIILSASAPGVPKYDGVRLFLPAFPFVACLAGLALKNLFQWLSGRLGSSNKAAACLGVYFLWQAIMLVAVHPFYLGFYGGLVGGPPGAHYIFKLESTYWMDPVTNDVFAVLNRRARSNGKFALSPYGAQAKSLIYSEPNKELRLVRPDLREVDMDKDWDIAVLNCRQGLFTKAEWELYKQMDKAVYTRSLFGVPLCLVFERTSK